jgi:D-tyrosyl-tRNA(Tyr) deacylase
MHTNCGLIWPAEVPLHKQFKNWHMKLFLQRVLAGSVTVGGNVIGEIGPGIVCLVGVHRDDTDADLEASIQKLFSVLLFPAEDGTPWQRTIRDVSGDLLLVSQFTLHARTSNGRRPDFSRSMGGDSARGVFDSFLQKAREQYNPEKIQTGEFGADMAVRIVNDGPTTFMFDSFSKK